MLMILMAVTPALSAKSRECYFGVAAWPQHDYWQPIWRGAEDAAKWLDVDFIVKGSMEYTAAGVIDVLEQVLARNPAGVIISGAACTPEALLPPINCAIDDGIPVIMFDSDSPMSKRYCFIGTDDARLGSIAADTLASIVKTRTGKIEGDVIVEYTPGALNLERRLQGFSETLKSRYPGLKIVARVDDEGQAAIGQTRVAQLLASKGNVVGIYGVHATAAIGIGAAVKEAKRVGRLAVVTMDDTKPALKLVEEGAVDAVIAQSTYHMGFWGMVAAYAVRHGIPNPIDGWNKAGVSPLPSWIDPGCNVITRANLSKFAN